MFLFGTVLAREGHAQDFELVSDASVFYGSRANDDSPWFSVSADGRFVAFASDAANLVEGDDNGLPDIFVRDRLTGTTERIPELAQNGAGLGRVRPDISDDGRWVVFLESASNFDANRTLGEVLLWDRQEEQLTPITADRFRLSDSAVISGDGGTIVFHTSSQLIPDGGTGARLVAYDRTSQTYETITVNVDGESVDGRNPDVSADGRFVTFDSLESRLVSIDVNNSRDVFLADRQTDSIELVSIASTGIQSDGDSEGASLSPDGLQVVFVSSGRTLVGDTNSNMDRIFLRDLQSSETTLVSRTPLGAVVDQFCSNPKMSQNGLEVLYWCSGDDVAGAPGSGQGFFRHQVGVNGAAVVTVPGLQLRETSAIDLSGAAYVASRTEVAEGASIANILRESSPGNIETISRASQADVWPSGMDKDATHVELADNGDIVFITDAASFTPDRNSRAFVISTNGSAAVLLTGLNGTSPNGADSGVSISSNSEVAVVATTSSNALEGWDLSESGALVMLDRRTDTRQLVAYGNTSVFQVQVSGNGSFALFRSGRDDIVSQPTNGVGQIYRTGLPTGDTLLVSTTTEGVPADQDTEQPKISHEGQLVAFLSASDVLADQPLGFTNHVFVKNLQSGQLSLLRRFDGSVFTQAVRSIDLSSDGRWLAFATSDNGVIQNAPLSGSHIYLADLASGELIWVSAGRFGPDSANYDCRDPDLSSAGIYLAFVCNQPDLVEPGVNLDLRFVQQAYRYHRPTRTLELVTRSSTGEASPGEHRRIRLSGTGRNAVLEGAGTRLVNGIPGTFSYQVLRAALGETPEIVFTNGFE